MREHGRSGRGWSGWNDPRGHWSGGVWQEGESESPASHDVNALCAGGSGRGLVSWSGSASGLLHYECAWKSDESEFLFLCLLREHGYGHACISLRGHVHASCDHV